MLNKQRFIKSALGLTLLSAAAFASAATTVQGGTVHFTGQIVNAACAVSADSMNQTVNMGQVFLSGLTATGQLNVIWGNGIDQQCIVDYQLPTEEKMIKRITASCS